MSKRKKQAAGERAEERNFEMERDFNYRSADGITDIHAVEWVPEGEVRAVYLIAHGMQEYVRRYTDFALYLNSKGIAVMGNDHLGHGESVISDDKHGFFAKENGNRCLIADMHRLRKCAEEKYPDKPVFYMGHSMGSFLVRQYIMMHGSGLAGAVIMGTGSQPAVVLSIGKSMCVSSSKKIGWNGVDRKLIDISMGSYNKRIKDPKTPVEWLTKERGIQEKYLQDPWCTFPFTVGAYHDMFTGIQFIQKKKNEIRIPKDLPLLLVAGTEDPVGHYGKDVPKLGARYQRLGIQDVSVKLYPGDRHEILNETDRAAVYDDISRWIEKHI